jgi:hypothetical protein
MAALGIKGPNIQHLYEVLLNLLKALTGGGRVKLAENFRAL